MTRQNSAWVSVYSIGWKKQRSRNLSRRSKQKDDTEQINPLYRDVDAAKKTDLETFPPPLSHQLCLLDRRRSSQHDQSRGDRFEQAAAYPREEYGILHAGLRGRYHHPQNEK